MEPLADISPLYVLKGEYRETQHPPTWSSEELHSFDGEKGVIYKGSLVATGTTETHTDVCARRPACPRAAHYMKL